MNIPKKLKIGGHTFVVDCSKELKNEMGNVEFKDNKISICKTLPQSQKESVLIHEIFHCINTSIDEISIGHSFMDSIAEQFYQVLSDNKLLK